MIAASALVLLTATARAQAPSAGDTYVSKNHPSQNYGNNSYLLVQSAGDSYIKFNLGTLPTSASVNKATLRLYVDTVAAGGTFDVYQVDGTWNENTLTYNTPPPLLGGSATGGHPVTISASSLNQFLLIDNAAGESCTVSVNLYACEARKPDRDGFHQRQRRRNSAERSTEGHRNLVHAFRSSFTNSGSPRCERLVAPPRFGSFRVARHPSKKMH